MTVTILNKDGSVQAYVGGKMVPSISQPNQIHAVINGEMRVIPLRMLATCACAHCLDRR